MGTPVAAWALEVHCDRQILGIRVFLVVLQTRKMDERIEFVH
jgi:hypothetical protein